MNTFRRPLLLCALIAMLSLLWISCGSPDESQGGTTPAEGDTLAVTPEDQPLDDCPDELDVICEDGLAFIPLGSFVSEVEVADLAAGHIQDSVESGNGYVWVSRTLHFDQGQVIVEGEFMDDRGINDTLLSSSRINRVRIESPLFRTTRDIRVGHTLQALLAAFPEGGFQVVPIPDYHAFQVRLPDSHIFYLVADTESMTEVLSPANLPVEALPQDAPIVAIVVM
jgi:hypothetical protein